MFPDVSEERTALSSASKNKQSKNSAKSFAGNFIFSFFYRQEEFEKIIFFYFYGIISESCICLLAILRLYTYYTVIKTISSNYVRRPFHLFDF
jgi:hypothetical protein